MGPHWSPEDEAVLRRFYSQSRVEDIAERLGRPVGQVSRKANRLGLMKTALYYRCCRKSTPYKRPAGSERWQKGFLYRKVSDDPYLTYHERWRPAHYLLWEAAHGPVPAGSVLLFKDQDPTHIALDNLLVRTRAELIAQYASMQHLPPDVRDAIRLLARVRRQLNRRKDP